MNAYDTTCFSHFLDLLTYIQKPPSLMIATFFCKKNQKNVVWIELRCWSKKEIFKIEFKNLKLFLKSSQEQHTRVQMKKSRHAVLSPNFSCVALMSLYNNHYFIRSTKNEEEKNVLRHSLKSFPLFWMNAAKIAQYEVCKHNEYIDLSINYFQWSQVFEIIFNVRLSNSCYVQNYISLVFVDIRL